VIVEDFAVEEVASRLRDRPGSVAWVDLFDPEAADLQAVAADFGLHPLAVEDAVEDHQRPKLDSYADHWFLNVYAVEFRDAGGSSHLHKAEISVFITKNVLITVRKGPGDLDEVLHRWDADAGMAAANGVTFLLYGLLDVVVDGQYAAARRIDEAMDAAEDAMLSEGGAPRPVRLYAFALRKALANLRRAVAPMPDVIARAGNGRPDHDLKPYYRDVEDHAQRAFELTEHARTRIDEMLGADLAEQSNVLNDVTRKLAAWAAIIAVPTALTGYFGQNVPYPGYERWWGFLVSTGLIVLCATGLYVFLRKRGWL
jgi:magnesium transporter